ncbi:MAG: ferritin family protein [Phycisphaerae bacterium]
MEQIRTDVEILELAIAREEDAYVFYSAMAEQVKDIQIRAVFEDLARDELEHKAKLELEYIKTGKVLPKKGPSEPRIFVQFNDADVNITYRNILRLAIDKEDSAFRFYIDMISNAQDQNSKDMLVALAQEEVKHKIRFENALNNLSQGV